MDLYALTDGREVSIRQIRADDRERLRESHSRLSPESRYRRFLATKPELSSSDARYLVEIDGSDHFALVATLPDQPGEPIVAVARYVRFADEPSVAEFAIVVGDEFQHQGLAGELMSRLARAAVNRGVHRFRATMLTDNIAVMRLAEAIADGPVRREFLGSLLEVELDLAAARGADVIPFPMRRAGAGNGEAEPAIITG